MLTLYYTAATDDQIAHFTSISGTTPEQARFYLDAAGGDIEVQLTNSDSLLFILYSLSLPSFVDRPVNLLRIRRTKRVDQRER